MPTYVYECAKCGEELEVWQSIKDDPLKRHNGGCGGKLAKVIQPAGIVLKGSGFYKNDSRGTRSAKSSGSSDKGSSDRGSSDKGSSDKGSSDKGSSGKGSSGSGASGKGATDSGTSGNGSGSGSTSSPSKSTAGSTT